MWNRLSVIHEQKSESSKSLLMSRFHLGSLPGKYNALVTAWDSVERGEQTLDNLRQRLINEEARMTATDEASDALAAMSLKVNKTQQRTREKKLQHSRILLNVITAISPVIMQRTAQRRKETKIEALETTGGARGATANLILARPFRRKLRKRISKD